MTTQRIHLVTGASRGIGRAAAIALARAGGHVIATARSEKALTTLDDEIRAATGSPATLVPMDLRDHAALDRLADAIGGRWGRLDGLLGNAGVLGTIGPLEMSSPSVFAETFDVNVAANWRLIRAFSPLLKSSEAGRAVFVGSGAAIRPRAFWGPYAAAKAALEAMVLCWADEVEALGVKVNLYDPGATRTDMRFKAMPGEDRSLLPTPEEVAARLPAMLAADFTANGQRFSFRDSAR